MRISADEDCSVFRVLYAHGEVMPKVRWADTDTGEVCTLYGLCGPEIVTHGLPFSIVRYPNGDTVAVYHGDGVAPRRRMRMHIDDDTADHMLRIFDCAGSKVPGVRWFDTETEEIGKLPTDERGRVRLDYEPLPATEEVLRMPFRVIDTRDGTEVIVSRSLQ